MSIKFRTIVILLLQLITIGVYSQTSQIYALQQLVQKSGKDTVKVNALNNLSKIYSKKGNNDTAWTYASEALKISQLLIPAYIAGEGNAYNNMGVVYLGRGNYNKAKEAHNTALVLWKAIDDKKSIAQTYNYLGTVHCYMSNYAEGLKYFLAALKLYKNIDDQQGLANAYNNIGLVYEYQGNYSGALKMHVVALKINERLGYSASLSACYSNIANIYFYQGNYKEAIKNNLIAVNISEKIEDKVQVSELNINIGIIYTAQGNYPEALQKYLEVLKVYEKLNDRLHLAIVYNNIGIIDDEMGNKNEALKNYVKSAEIYEELHNKEGMGDTYDNIAGIYFSEKKYDEALKKHAVALTIRQEIEDKIGIAASYYNIGQTYFKIGNLPEALKNYNASLKLYKEAGSVASVAVCNISLCEFYIHLKQYSEAEKYGLEALSIATEIGVLNNIRDANKYLSTIYSATGRDKQALEYYEKYMVANDSLVNEENTRKVMQQQMEYDFNKKEAEERAANEAEEQKITLIYTISLIGIIVVIIVFFIVANKNRQLKLLKLKNEFEVEKANARIALQQKLEDLRLEALNAAVNPQFIFNTLGAIQGYVSRSNPFLASDYIAKFARLIRITLNYAGEKYISVEEELNRLNAYLELEKLRCGDKLQYTIEVDEKVDPRSKLPNMVIQPLLENAIIHGILMLPNDATGIIKVRIAHEGRFLVITVTDNGVGIDTNLVNKPGYRSVGLSNLKERISVIHNSYFDIRNRKETDPSQSGTIATIKIPLE